MNRAFSVEIKYIYRHLKIVRNYLFYLIQRVNRKKKEKDKIGYKIY